MSKEIVEHLAKAYSSYPPKEKAWGYTIPIDHQFIPQFLESFFPGTQIDADITPRFLVVQAGARLSWQKHERRSELWKVVQGPVGVMLSYSDEQPEVYAIKQVGEVIKIETQMRHRLIGLDTQGVVAEIWIHTDPDNHSDGGDIVRIQDDYLR